MNRTLVIGLFIALGWAPGTLASSLENMDTVDYNVIVISGDTMTTIVIKAGEKIETVCDNCVLQLVGKDDSVFDVYVDEAVAIRNGEFFLPDDE